MKLYLIDFDNGYTGGFYDESFDQAFNTTNSLLGWSIQHTMKLKNVKSIEIEFLKSLDELNKLRKQNGKNAKPTLDEYLQNFMENYVKNEKTI